MLPLFPLPLHSSPVKVTIIILPPYLLKHYQGNQLPLSLSSSSRHKGQFPILQKVTSQIKTHTKVHLMTKYQPQMSTRYPQKSQVPCNEEFQSMWMFCNEFTFLVFLLFLNPPKMLFLCNRPLNSLVLYLCKLYCFNEDVQLLIKGTQKSMLLFFYLRMAFIWLHQTFPFLLSIPLKSKYFYHHDMLEQSQQCKGKQFWREFFFIEWHIFTWLIFGWLILKDT